MLTVYENCAAWFSAACFSYFVLFADFLAVDFFDRSKDRLLAASRASPNCFFWGSVKTASTSASRLATSAAICCFNSSICDA